jgi:hypothetical protein
MKNVEQDTLRELEKILQNLDIKSAEKYILKHKSDILQIYYNYGSGSEYLLQPYNQICLDHPKEAAKYQELLETNIAGDVLFCD